MFISRATLRITLILSAFGLLVAQAPFSAAENCITQFEGLSNTNQVIVDSTTDSIKIGVKLADPGAGKALIFIIRPNSCTSGGFGPSLIGRSSQPAPTTSDIPGIATDLMVLP